MKKRWICGLLAAVMLLSLLSGMPVKIRATGETTPEETVPEETVPEETAPEETTPEESAPEETTPEETTPEETLPEEDGPMTVSDDFIEVLKTMEGFAPVAYWDYSQWTIGYGTKCPEGMEHYYTKENPFPEEEAVKLLHQELTYFETVVNNFAEKYSLELAQHQFDALVSFSYNCGGGWTNDTSGYLNTAVREGDMSNRLIYGMCLWSTAGGDYILIGRRKSEANMYINGEYKAYNTANSIPANFKHVFLDGNGGTPRYAIHGYNADDPAGVVTNFRELPTGVDKNGKTFTYTFAGWFTAPIGGTQITVLDGSLANGTILYAQWKNPEGEIVALPKGDLVDNIAVTVTSSVNIRSGPGTYYPVKQVAEPGAMLTITETFMVGSSLWGKCEYGWLSLNYTDYEDVISGGNEPEEEEPRWGTVTGNKVNIRSGPGTSYSIVGQKNTGDRVLIYEHYYDGTREWGRMEDGNWICLDYVALDEVVTLESIAVETPPTKKEYVQMQDVLNLSGGTLTLTYSDGSVKTVAMTADMISGFSNTKLGDVAVTVTYGEKTTTFTVTIIKATVVFKNYDGTVLSSAQYAYGDAVVQPAAPVKPADNAYTYEFAGWDKNVTTCNGDAVYTAVFRAVAIEADGQWGTVTTKTGDNVNVRTGPGTGYDVAYSKITGDRVQIFAQKSDGTREWGQLEDGNWICLDYVVFDVEPEPEPEFSTGDIDQSDLVNEDDAIYLLRHVVFPDKYPIAVSGDMNADGIVNEEDAIYLLRHVVFPDKYPLK